MAVARKTHMYTSEVVHKKVDEITLSLSMEEAQALADLTTAVGGAPATTRRGLTQKIQDALRSAGVAANTMAPDLGGSVSFRPKPKPVVGTVSYPVYGANPFSQYFKL